VTFGLFLRWATQGPFGPLVYFLLLFLVLITQYIIEKQGYLYHFYGSLNWNPSWLSPLTSCCLIHRAINSGSAASDKQGIKIQDIPKTRPLTLPVQLLILNLCQPWCTRCPIFICTFLCIVLLLCFNVLIFCDIYSVPACFHCDTNFFCLIMCLLIFTLHVYIH